jgi:predicted Zn-dependent peptidase
VRLRALIALVTMVLASCGLALASPDLPQLGQRVTVAHLQGDSGTVIVESASGAPVAAVELWYRAPSVGFGPKPIPSLARVAAQTVAGSRPIVGDSLGEAVNRVGGKLAITTYGNSVSISALVPADSARAIVKSMTIAYFSPVVTDAGFKAATGEVATDALFASFDPQTIVRDAVFAQLFVSGPQHYPALGAAKDIASIPIESVRSFAVRAFRAQNAVLVISGSVDSSVAAAASKGRPSGETADTASTPEPASASELAGPSTPVSKPFEEPGGGYAWVGPPIADERSATAMDFLADYLFRPGSGTVSRDVAARFPNALVSGQFVTLHDPGVLFVSFSGAPVDGLRDSVDRGVAMVRKPLDPALFSRAVEAFEYHLLSDLQTPTELADNFGWYAVEGNLEYAPGANGAAGAYFRAAASLTPEFVAQLAQKYLDKPSAGVSLVPEAKPLPSKGTPS